MTTGSDGSAFPLEPIKDPDIETRISQFASGLGIPYLSLKYERIDELTNQGLRPIRHLLDFMSEGGTTPCDITKEIIGLEGQAKYRISTYIRSLPPRKQPPLSLFKKEFPEAYSNLVSPDGLWQETTTVIPNTSSFAYALDSFAKWPSWLLINTRAPLSELQGSDVNDPVRRLEGEQLGLRREMVRELFPCKVIRFNQDLVRISRDQLALGPQEAVIVDFEVGPFGYQFLNANPPTLEYALWGDAKENVVQETIQLSMDNIKYGLRLPQKAEAVQGKAIHGSSLKLFLGKTLIDHIGGFYIREIHIDVKLV